MSDKKLPKTAYGGVAGKDYVPYVTQPGVGYNALIIVVGIIFAAIFAASNAYSGMKSGLTVAAGIPGAILGSAVVMAFAKKKGILGKNILQGMACGGESIASGMIFVVPAILLIGHGIGLGFMETFIASFGGLCLGVGVSALMHNYLMVEEHGNLIYPEAMAISESLVAGEGNESAVKFMGLGFGIAGIITVLTGSFFNVINSFFSVIGKSFYKWKFETDVSPLLVGIGFIVGLEVALAMFAGTFFSHFAIMPLIGYFTELAGEGTKAWNNASLALRDMNVNDIAGTYVKYIGAGMMLGGGIIGVIKLIPTIISSLKATFGSKSSTSSSKLSNIILLAGVIIAFISGFLISGGNVLMAVLASVLSVLLASLFIIVAARLCGMIGTSNLPVSGMTIASIVIVTLLFVQMGWVSLADNKSLLLFGTFIVVAISVGGGYNQSQKVAFIIGGSKDQMQKGFMIAAFIGVLTSTAVIMLLAPQLSNTVNPTFALPQANLISTLTSGIMQGSLPWVMIIVGIAISIVLHFLNLPIMMVAVGFYLPISTTSAILVGSTFKAIHRKSSKEEKLRDIRVSAGVSLASGLVAGGAIIGLIGIALQVGGIIHPMTPSGILSGNFMAVILMVVLIFASLLPIMKAKE